MTQENIDARIIQALSWRCAKCNGLCLLPIDHAIAEIVYVCTCKESYMVDMWELSVKANGIMPYAQPADEEEEE